MIMKDIIIRTLENDNVQLRIAGILDELANIQLPAGCNAQACRGVGVGIEIDHQGLDAGGQGCRGEAERH